MGFWRPEPTDGENVTTDNRRALVWSDDFLVGVPEIDEQHRRLLELLAEFYEKLAEAEHGSEALGALVCGLLDYTRYHFTTEERLMRQSGFPESVQHREQHASFVARAADMADRFTRGRLVLSLEATGFLRDWLFNHILVTDKALGRHILSREAAQ